MRICWVMGRKGIVIDGREEGGYLATGEEMNAWYLSYITVLHGHNIHYILTHFGSNDLRTTVNSHS